MLQQHLPFTALKLLVTIANISDSFLELQQHLPFTVLKPSQSCTSSITLRFSVATAITVYGIETIGIIYIFSNHYFVATVLTVYGIET